MSYLGDTAGGMVGEALANQVQPNGGLQVFYDTSEFTGVAAYFRQTVILESEFTGVAAYFRQTISSEFQGVAAYFRQRIITGDSSFFEKWGWDITVYTSDMVITTLNTAGNYGLCDQMTIKAAENESRQLTFVVIPPEGPQDAENFIGEHVEVVAKTSDGLFTIFTGYIDVPLLDLKSRKVTFTCSDRRANSITQLDPSIIQSVGYYSEAIFGKSKDAAEELEKRLQTVPYSFDFTNNGLPTLTAWVPKTTPDFTLGNGPGEIYWREPKVTYTSRLKTINTVNLTLNYSYQRLHQQVKEVVWPGYEDFCSSYWNQGRPSFPERTTITQAAQGENWIVQGHINFVDIWPTTFFSCNGGVQWEPNTVTYTYAKRRQLVGYLKDAQGNDITIKGVRSAIYEDAQDAFGNAIMDPVSKTTVNTSGTKCRGASWVAATRFAQQVKETYNVSIIAQSSVTQNGPVVQNQTVDVDDPFETEAWEKSKQPNSANINFYVDKKLKYGEFLNTYSAAIAQAKVSILKVHRDVVVSFSKPLWAMIDLNHTVAIDASIQVPNWTQGIVTKGKVGNFTHTIDFNSTRQAVTSVELYLSRSQGESEDTPISFTPVTQNPGYIGNVETINLGTHIGINPDPSVSPTVNTWNGYIGNRSVTAGTYETRTNYPEAFIVDYPAISDSLRLELNYENEEETFEIAIPNDDLETSL